MVAFSKCGGKGGTGRGGKGGTRGERNLLAKDILCSHALIEFEL